MVEIERVPAFGFSWGHRCVALGTFRLSETFIGSAAGGFLKHR
jgi:hypothetical protein